MDDTSLVELFYAELRAHLGALDAALASVANRTDHRVSAAIGADLLRAAHSLKGAAKIMGLREAERLGRAMEAQCAMVERGGTLSPELVRALSTAGAILGGLTTLPEAGFAGWEVQQRAAIDDQIAALEGAPTPPAAPRASHEIETATDDGMLEMFRLEVETQAAAMSDRLVALEADPTQLEALEPVMRAAHSIKGAARIVGIDPAVRLAHSMEDLLIAMQRQRAGVTPHAIDMLLRCTDLLVQAAESTRGSVASWTHVHGGEVDDLCSTLGVLMRAPASALAVDKRTLARDEGGAVDKAGVQDRVVRVSAANIDRLMGLAGESLVEARRMQPFADSLHGLLQRQSALRDVLEELAYAPPERAGALLAAARERAQECKAAVIERVTEFEGFVRRSEDVTTRLYRETIASRMRPFADGVKGFARLIRDLASLNVRKKSFPTLP